MPKLVYARHEPTLHAQVIRRTPLYYREGAKPEIEQPDHVRAGSSLAQIADYVAVIQDDANFIALIDLHEGKAESVPLPAGPDGHHVFDRAHGNRSDKLDLEACVTIPHNDGHLLVAFGSGSGPERDQIVVVRWSSQHSSNHHIDVYDGQQFYAVLSAAHEFAGSELNIEGAVYLGDDRLRLFNRGNGKARGDQQPCDATCDVRWSTLWNHLQHRDRYTPPQPQDIVQYQLGSINGLRLNFSDAEAAAGVILYSAAAEGSASAGSDGRIAGSALGVIDKTSARWTELVDHQGQPCVVKIEGLTLRADDPFRVYFVADQDTTEQPSELFEVALRGPWFSAAPDH